jgi:hypothetical protein
VHPLFNGFVKSRWTQMSRLRPHPTPSPVTFTSPTTPKVAPIFLYTRGMSCTWTHNGECVKSICVGGMLSSISFSTSKLPLNNHGHPSLTRCLSGSMENSISQRFSWSSLNTTLPTVFHNRDISSRKASFCMHLSDMSLPMRHLPLFILQRKWSRPSQQLT